MGVVLEVLGGTGDLTLSDLAGGAGLLGLAGTVGTETGTKNTKIFRLYSGTPLNGHPSIADTSI